MAESLAPEIATYEREKMRLEGEHRGKYVLIRGDSAINVFATLHDAAAEGLRQFGAEPFLIRRIGDGPLKISVAGLYGLTHAGDPVQLSIG